MNLLKRWFSNPEPSKPEPFKSIYPMWEGNIGNHIMQKCKTFAADSAELESIYRRLIRLLYVSLSEDGDDSTFLLTITHDDIVKSGSEFNFHMMVNMKESSLRMNVPNVLCQLDSIARRRLSVLQICNEPTKPFSEIHFIFLLEAVERPLMPEKRPKSHDLYVFPPPVQILKACESKDSKIIENWKRLMGALEHFFITSYMSSFEMVLEQFSISETKLERRFYFVLKILSDSVCIDLYGLYKAIHYACYLHNIVLYFGPLAESRKNHFRFAILEDIKQVEKEKEKKEVDK
jgi:hypothetical protein